MVSAVDENHHPGASRTQDIKLGRRGGGQKPRVISIAFSIVHVDIVVPLIHLSRDHAHTRPALSEIAVRWEKELGSPLSI